MAGSFSSDGYLFEVFHGHDSNLPKFGVFGHAGAGRDRRGSPAGWQVPTGTVLGHQGAGGIRTPPVDAKPRI